jgi:hypothetical protein
MKGEFLFSWLILIVLFVYLAPGGCSKDDTDSANGRSGMNLYTDAKTGCQYLGHGFGGLIPRVDVTGKQLCSTVEVSR